uniref:Uncharacterized protein n=1 Tax=viral metagenome TaxID=1070528 RepID=A0A6C0H6F4_9ZZZZ
MGRGVNTKSVLQLRNGKKIVRNVSKVIKVSKVSKVSNVSNVSKSNSQCTGTSKQNLCTEQTIMMIRQALKKCLAKNSILLRAGCIDWCFPDSNFVKSLSPQSEKTWGTSVIGYTTNQWTTKLGETLLKETLEGLGESPRRIVKRQAGENGKHLIPDWETTNGLYECKARTYTTTGTAGEKVLGSPWKYSDCRELYNKPLYIVCMAYQQQEAEDDFKLFGSQSPIRQRLLEYYQREAGIQYIRFTDLLKRFTSKQY